MIFGYSVSSALAIYFLIWWIILFAVLPFGVKTQEEAGEVAEGTMSSAPSKPMLVRKALITTGLACVIFALFIAVTRSGLSLKDIPIPGYDS